jgi:hypothetical protein
MLPITPAFMLFCVLRYVCYLGGCLKLNFATFAFSLFAFESFNIAAGWSVLYCLSLQPFHNQTDGTYTARLLLLLLQPKGVRASGSFVYV